MEINQLHQTVVNYRCIAFFNFCIFENFWCIL